MNDKTLANISLITGLVLPYAMVKTAGSRSLEDILYLAESRGGKHFVKISRTLAPGSEERQHRNKALNEIVMGELALRNIPRDYNVSDKEYYFDLFGKNWDDVNSDWTLRTDSTGYSGGDFEYKKYMAQKHIFKDSVDAGITYYIKLKPDDMYDPIEEEGFALQGRDAIMNIQDLYRMRDFLVGKYGNRDRFRGDLALKNLEMMGFNNIGDIIEAAKTYKPSNNQYRRLSKEFDEASINIASFVEDLWKKAWTVPARMDARIRARRIKK